MDFSTDRIRTIASAMTRDKWWPEEDITILMIAADIIDFVCDQMQMHSPKMDGTASYRFRRGWPVTRCVGATPIDALLAAMQEVEREKRKNEAK